MTWFNQTLPVTIKSGRSPKTVYSSAGADPAEGRSPLLKPTKVTLLFCLLLMLFRSVCHQVSNQTNRSISSSGDYILLSANVSPTYSSGLFQGNVFNHKTYSIPITKRWLIIKYNHQKSLFICLFESNFIHHDFFYNSENSIRDIRPFCHPLFCHSSFLRYTSSPLR